MPYRGSAGALGDLLPNTIQMMNEINVLPHVKAGKLILLDINYAERHPEFFDVPTLTELVFPNSRRPRARPRTSSPRSMPRSSRSPRATR